MKRLAFLFAFAVAGFLLAFSVPGAHAQAKCGNDICIGSKNTKVRVGGNLSVASPDGGLSVDATGIVSAPQVRVPASSTSGLTKVLTWSSTIDFATATTTCTESSGITVTGAASGDTCLVAPPTTGGSTNAAYTCYVSASNTIKARHCAAGTADDPASATFTGFVISSQ